MAIRPLETGAARGVRSSAAGFAREEMKPMRTLAFQIQSRFVATESVLHGNSVTMVIKWGGTDVLNIARSSTDIIVLFWPRHHILAMLLETLAVPFVEMACVLVTKLIVLDIGWVAIVRMET
jgi:hypothetical protein